MREENFKFVRNKLILLAKDMWQTGLGGVKNKYFYITLFMSAFPSTT